MWKNSLAHCIRQSDNVANIVNRSSSVFQDSISHFCHFFIRGSGRRPSRTLFIIDWFHPFLIRLNHSSVCIWLRALLPNAYLSILCVSEAVLPSVEQNLMQICCSFTSVILAVSTITKQHLHDITKMQRKKHARRHSRTPLGKVVYKGSSLQYLMAHNCTTSGFHVTFQFQGLLCSTSCLTTCNVFLCLIDWQWNRWCSADSKWDCRTRDNAWKPSERASDKIPEE